MKWLIARYSVFIKVAKKKIVRNSLCIWINHFDVCWQKKNETNIEFWAHFFSTNLNIRYKWTEFTQNILSFNNIFFLLNMKYVINGKIDWVIYVFEKDGKISWKFSTCCSTNCIDIKVSIPVYFILANCIFTWRISSSCAVHSKMKNHWLMLTGLLNQKRTSNEKISLLVYFV